MNSGFLLFLLMAAAPEDDAPVLRLPPVDECASDPDFVTFRNELQRAVELRDRAHLIAIIDEDIESDFGGDGGREEFIRAWQLDRPGQSPIWDELRDVLSLGCSVEGEESLWAPSLYLQLEDDYDLTSAAVALQGGELHAAPNADSPVLARLDWEVVTIQADDGQGDWLPITLADGRSGFARRRDVRSALDYRAGFERFDGRWRMTYFIAGD